MRSKGLLQDFATNTLGRAARKRTQSQASVGGGEDNEDELELIRGDWLYDRLRNRGYSCPNNFYIEHRVVEM